MFSRLRMLFVALMVVSALNGAAPVAAQQETKMTTPKGFLIKTIQHDGAEMRYVLYVPADYDPAKPWPTILFLHGAGECGHDGLRQVGVGIGKAVMANPEKWPFLILIPQKPDVAHSWASFDSLLMELLDSTKKTYNVDESRLYLTGLSQGGYGTWAVGAKHPDLFAALAPICGGGKPETASALKSVPIWAFHGEADTTVPIKMSEEMVKAVKDAGGDVKFTTYPGVGHNSWDKAYGEAGLADWLLQHVRK